MSCTCKQTSLMKLFFVGLSKIFLLEFTFSWVTIFRHSHIHRSVISFLRLWLRSRTGAIAKSFVSKSGKPSLPHKDLNPTSVSVKPNTSNSLASENDALVSVDNVSWHCQTAVRGTAKVGTANSMALPNCHPWHCQQWHC